MYSLRRKCDGAGDSGIMSKAVWLENGKPKDEDNARPRVGVRMVVGSWGTSTYSDQDFWVTTEIVEILEEYENEVTFRTNNSMYIWRCD